MAVKKENLIYNFREHWLGILLAVSVLSFALSFLTVFLSSSPPPVNGDAAHAQHLGWYITQGGIPYVDIWKAKPPVLFEFMAILGFLSGGNMWILHLITVLLTSAAGIGIVLLAGIIVHDRTGNPDASFLAGLAVLGFAGVHHLSASGFADKYFAVFFGLLSLYLFFRERFFLSGFAAAAGTGFWHLAVAIPVVVLGMAAQQRRKGVFYRALGGMVVLTFLSLLPVIVVWDAFVPMIVEVVLVPIYGGAEGSPLLLRIGKIGLLLGYASLLIVLGVLGVVWSVRKDWEQYWWASAVLGWFLIQILFLDMDWYPDLIPVTAFAGIGVGLLYTRVRKDVWRQFLFLSVTMVTIVSVIGYGGFGVVTYPITSPSYPINTDVSPGSQPLLPAAAVTLASKAGIPISIDSAGPSEVRKSVAPDTPSMVDMYWSKTIPESCRYRFGRMPQSWLDATNQSWGDPCGRWPSSLS